MDKGVTCGGQVVRITTPLGEFFAEYGTLDLLVSMLCQASLERLAAWLLSMPSSAGVQLRREDAANAILAAADSHAPIYPLLRLVVQLCRQITVLMMRDENIRRQFHAAQLKRADDVCGRSKPSPPPSNMVTCTCCFPSSLPPLHAWRGGREEGV